jgi:hypothetical protein
MTLAQLTALHQLCRLIDLHPLIASQHQNRAHFLFHISQVKRGQLHMVDIQIGIRLFFKIKVSKPTVVDLQLIDINRR